MIELAWHNGTNIPTKERPVSIIKMEDVKKEGQSATVMLRRERRMEGGIAVKGKKRGGEVGPPPT